MTKSLKGKFISFEGVEGSGKSTQIKLLAHYFNNHDIEFIETLEPGGTGLGLELRHMLLSGKHKLTHPLTELLLFSADRCEHINQIIKPALESGKTVICDRYIDSTYAYQVGGRRLSFELIDNLINQLVIKPDITILLDFDPKEGLKRAKKRAEMDRFEQEDLHFHNRVRQGYLKQHSREPSRIKKVDVTNLDPESVFSQILSVLI